MKKLKSNYIFRINFRFRTNAAYTIWTHSSIVGEVIKKELSRDGVSLLKADLCEGDYLKQISNSPHNQYRMGSIKPQFARVPTRNGSTMYIYYQLTKKGAEMEGKDATINTIEQDVDLSSFY